MNRKILSIVAVAALAFFASDLGAQVPYTLSIESGQVAPGGNLAASVLVDSAGGGDIQGWSFGVCHDGSAVSVLSYTQGSAIDAILMGAMLGFNSINLTPAGGTGFTQGAVIDLFGVIVLPPNPASELGVANYTNNMPNGVTTDLEFCDTLGAPPVATLVVVLGASIVPVQASGTWESFVPPTVDHIRADSNDDGIVNIADGVWILNDLFQGGPTTDCFGANDANSDGSYDAADAVFIFNYQFLEGGAPAAPFPACGGDADPDPADCASFSSCP